MSSPCRMIPSREERISGWISQKKRPGGIKNRLSFADRSATWTDDEEHHSCQQPDQERTGRNSGRAGQAVVLGFRRGVIQRGQLRSRRRGRRRVRRRRRSGSEVSVDRIAVASVVQEVDFFICQRRAPDRDVVQPRIQGKIAPPSRFRSCPRAAGRLCC